MQPAVAALDPVQVDLLVDVADRRARALVDAVQEGAESRRRRRAVRPRRRPSPRRDAALAASTLICGMSACDVGANLARPPGRSTSSAPGTSFASIGVEQLRRARLRPVRDRSTTSRSTSSSSSVDGDGADQRRERRQAAPRRGTRCSASERDQAADDGDRQRVFQERRHGGAAARRVVQALARSSSDERRGADHAEDDLERPDRESPGRSGVVYSGAADGLLLRRRRVSSTCTRPLATAARAWYWCLDVRLPLAELAAGGEQRGQAARPRTARTRARASR